jgi:hypothetical protein
MLCNWSEIIIKTTEEKNTTAQRHWEDEAGRRTLTEMAPALPVF